jgi:hypothetical protein
MGVQLPNTLGNMIHDASAPAVGSTSRSEAHVAPRASRTTDSSKELEVKETKPYVVKS